MVLEVGVHDGRAEGKPAVSMAARAAAENSHFEPQAGKSESLLEILWIF